MSSSLAQTGGRELPLRVGISARLAHRPPPQFGFSGQAIQYLDPSMAYWLMRHNTVAFMVPTIETAGGVVRSSVSIADYVREVDGLVLQGGADVSPTSYGEEPLRAEWGGDRVRDLYELDLLWECIIQRRPVLGICRGHQLINVAFGGSLYQDIGTQLPNALHHINPALYDGNAHEIEFVRGTLLAGIYADQTRAIVSSLHHQSVKTLGDSIVVEAHSTEDHVVEAIRWTGAGYVAGVQWHPEFHRDRNANLLAAAPLMADFLAAVRSARAAR